MGENNWSYYPGSEGPILRFQFNGDFVHLADFQKTPGGQGGGYLLHPAAMLGESGLPATEPGHVQRSSVPYRPGVYTLTRAPAR